MTNLEQWHADLIADGWKHKPIYKGDKSAEFKRDGFVVHIYYPPQLSHISAWGPDKLTIDLPELYDFAAMQRATLICSRCGAVGGTVSLGFAGRVCPACRKEHAPRVEYRSWCS